MTQERRTEDPGVLYKVAKHYFDKLRLLAEHETGTSFTEEVKFLLLWTHSLAMADLAKQDYYALSLNLARVEVNASV